MHILIIPSWYPESQTDFHGSFFREQAEALAESGHNVGVLYCKEISLHQIVLKNLLPPNRKPAYENQLRVIRSRSFRKVPKNRLKNLTFTEREVRKMYRQYVRQFGKPDLLHAHAMFPAGAVAQRLAETENIPYVVTEHRHETSLAELQEEDARQRALTVADEAASLIAVSPQFAARLNQEYSIEKWVFIPNLLPKQFENQEVKSKAEYETQKYVFGHVSNLQPKKRVLLTMQAFLKAFNNDPAVELRIVGESNYREELIQQADDMGLNNVHFVGAVGRDEIKLEFNRFDSFVLASNSEPFGVVFWEAMASGLPIIATNTDGGSFAVTEDTGYLIPIDDLNELTKALIQMRQNRHNFDSEKIRTNALSVSGCKTFLEKYNQIYSSALNSYRR